MSATTAPESAAALAATVRTGERTAVEVTRSHLDRIESDQTRLNAYTLIVAEAALAAAAEVDAVVAAGDDPGPLAGVPVAVKDLIDQEGLPTTAGSGFPQAPAAADAPAIARLREAGAVLVGRTGLHEFAFGFSSENHWYGPVRNPWDLDTSPGGSSGGSAATVAARHVPVALGTDTGGSIRVPAALCGVFGLKVTHGRVPLTGVFPLAASLDTVGPIARSCEDLSLAYSVIAGHDPADPWSSPRPVAVRETPASVARCRFVVPHPWVDRALDTATAAGWEWWLEALREAGAIVADRDIPELEFPGMVSEAMYPEVAAVHRRRFAASPDRYGPEVRTRVEMAVAADMDAYFDGLAWRNRMREAALNALGDADILTTPAVAGLRKQIGVDTMDIGGSAVSYRAALSCFSAPVNHLGFPALAAPLALPGTPPASVQLIAGPWAEDALLALGRGLEDAGLVAVRSPAGDG